MIFDGDCDFCRTQAGRWARAAGLDGAPFQECASRFPEISAKALASAVHLVDTRGIVYRGAEAGFRLLAAGGGAAWPLWLYRRVPGFRAASEFVYLQVARHRSPLPAPAEGRENSFQDLWRIP